MDEEVQHGPQAYWDNIGMGYRIECLCGWLSSCCDCMEYAGEDFDDHMREMRGCAK